jgi:hypothetical protein
MRTPLLSLATVLLLGHTTKAQINAGDVPTGTAAIPFNINLVLNNANTTTSASLELDCDDQPEINVVLIQGQIALDDPNIARLDIVDQGLELCMGSNDRPKYYAAGQVLDCSGTYDWGSVVMNVIGDYGGFFAVGPGAVNDMYVAYRLNGEIGWIRLSFNLESGISVDLQIPEALSLCGSGTGIDDPDALSAMSLFPNPSNGDGMIRVESPSVVQGIEVLDATGKMIARYGAATQVIAAPEAPGVYLVRARSIDGQWSIVRLMRN